MCSHKNFVPKQNKTKQKKITPKYITQSIKCKMRSDICLFSSANVKKSTESCNILDTSNNEFIKTGSDIPSDTFLFFWILFLLRLPMQSHTPTHTHKKKTNKQTHFFNYLLKESKINLQDCILLDFSNISINGKKLFFFFFFRFICSSYLFIFF